MENKPSMSRVERLHREKVTRYSIRKYSFGAASVAVAALFMFLGNGAVSVQADQIQPVQPGDTAAAPATPTLDKTQLESYISEIETKLSNGSYDNKTEESVAVLKAELESAKATLANATTQAELKKAYSKLVTTANSKLKNKPVEKKETPAVDTTEGKETVGKSAENTEKKSDSNSIENTGSNDTRNGQALDKHNAFRTETDTEKPKVSIDYDDAASKTIWVTPTEETNITGRIKITDNSGKIVKGWMQKMGSGTETDIGYGLHNSNIDREATATADHPATLSITGKLQDRHPNGNPWTNGSTVVSRKVRAKDASNNEIDNEGASDPAYQVFFKVRSQNVKYTEALANKAANFDKVAVANPAQLQQPELDKIKAKLQEGDGNNLNGKIATVTQSGDKVVITYNDGTTAERPVTDFARVNEKPTAEFPFSNAAAKEIYVYGAEENSFDIKIKDDSGKISSATVRRGGNREFDPVPGATNKISTQYGYTANTITTETPATDANPAVITYSGTPAATDGLKQDKLDAATRGETSAGLTLGWRFLRVADADGGEIGGSATGADDPGSFVVILKPQTQKYDVTTPENEAAKVPVVDANHVTDAEFAKIVGANNANIKLHYSKTNTDANLVGKQGQNVDDKDAKIKSVTKVDNNMVVTYKDGSTDTLPLTKFARTNAAPTVEIPYSVEGKKDVYVYANEDFEIPVKFTDDSGKVASATIKRGGNQDSPAKDASNPDVLDNQYNTTVEKISTETPATAENPAIVKIKGNISKDNSGIAENKFPKEAGQELTIVTRYATATDTDGAFIENTATSNSYATDPGSFTIKLKAQTAKYDIKTPATKVPVVDANNVTEAEFNEIKKNIKIQYSTENPDKNLADKKGTEVENQDDRIESITKDGNNVVVTYKDGSKDSKPLTDFARTNPAPTVELPYSNPDKKQIYVYTGENTDLTFKASDDAEVKDLYLRGPGGIGNDNTAGYGFTTGKIDNDVVTNGEGTVSDDKRTATIKMTGVTTLTAPNKWTSFVVANDNDNARSLPEDQNFDAVDRENKPGYVEFIVKSQTDKYDIKAPTEKVAVTDPANVTEAELAKIKEKLQLEHNKNNDDANISKDAPVTDKDDKIASVTKDDQGNLVVTYADGSKDTRPLSEFVTLDKQPAIDEVNKAAEKQIAAINSTPNATDEEKAAAIAKVNADKQKALDEIAKPEVTTKDALDKAQTAGTGAIAKDNPVVSAKPAAKKAIDDALAAKNKAIDARPDLTPEEKTKAKEAAKAAADKAKEAVDAATTDAEVTKAKEAGTKAVADVTPVAKAEAKKAIAKALEDKNSEIDKRTDLTDEEKTAAKNEAKDKADAQLAEIAKQPDAAATPEAAQTAQTAVDGAKAKGVADVKAVNPVAKAKPEAKKAIDKALEAKNQEIDARTDLTPEEKTKAKEVAKAQADVAKDAVDAATTNAAVDKAKADGTTAVANVTPVVKEVAKKAIADELAEKEKAIDARKDLTDAEKAKAKEEAQAKAKEATDAINKQPDVATTPTAAKTAQDAVDAAKAKGVADVKAVNPVAKEAAKQAIADELAKKVGEIDARPDLTDKEKDAAKKDAQAKAKKATDAINAQPDNAETPEKAAEAQTAVDGAKDKGVADVKAVNPVAKEKAKEEIAKELAKKEEAIDGRKDLTDEEKDAAKKDAQAKAKEATDAIDAQPSIAETPEKAAEAKKAVDGAKDKGVADVKAVNPVAAKKPEAKEAVDAALKAKVDAINAREDLTPAEKDEAKKAAEKAADDAKKAIDAATTDAAVDAAKNAGTGEVAKVNPVAKEKAKEEIAKELAKKEEAIDERKDLTDEEKAAAKEEAQAKAKEATDAINDQPANAETPEKAAEAQKAVDGAKDKGVADVKAVNPEAVTKPAAKKAIEDKLAKQLEDIANTPDATDEEKKVAADAAKALAEEAKEEIDKAGTDAEVKQLQEKAEGEIEKSVPVVEDKPNARKAIDEEATAKKAEIDARNDLTPEAKAKLKAKVDKAAEKSKAAIDAVSSVDDVNTIEEADKAAIKAIGEVNRPIDKVLVKDPSALTDEEKAKILEEVKKVNPTAKEVKYDENGNIEVTTEAGDKGIINPTKLVKTEDQLDNGKGGNDINKPLDKVIVKDPSNLTDEEKAKIVAKVEEVNPDAIVTIDENGTVSVSTPEGKTAAIPASELVRTKEDTSNPDAGNSKIVKPADKVAGEANDPDDQAKVEEKLRELNPETKSVKFDEDGNATVTLKDGTTATIPSEDLFKSEVDATKPNAGNDIVKPADKTVVANPEKLTDAEKKAIEDKVKAVNPDATVVVDDKGNATVTTPEGKTAVIPAADLTKDPEAATKPNAGNDIVKPADKTVVANPEKLTDAEKKAIEDKVKAVNPDATVVVDDKGNATVTTPEGKTAVIPAADLTKDPEAATKPNAGNDIVKPADKTVVANPEKLTDAEKKAIEDKVKAVNPDATVVVDDKGNATVTTPEGKTAVIPAADLTKDPEAATKPNAGNDIVKPADKTVVANPEKLTDAEKKAIEDKVKAVNPDATVVVDDKGNATVTTPEGNTAVIPAADLTKDPEAATKPNAGNDIVKPADKTVVANPEKLTDAEKKAIEDKVKAVNPDATVVVDDKGNATVTTPEGKTAVIPAADLTKDPEAATKPNAGNDIVKPADKTVVANPEKLTDAEKKAIEDKVKAVNPDATVVVDDKGNATVTTPEGKTAVIPAADLTKDPEAATKPNAGNDIVKPADKTVVANPEKLTDAEKKAIEDKVKAVNPDATVVVDDKGNATVTTPEGKTAVIPAADLTKDPEAATKPNAGNDIVKPADKTVVANPEKLTDAEKKAIEDKVKAVNRDATVVVDDKGNATVTTPEGKTAVIPAADLTKDPEAATKPNAGNDIVKPADKTVVANPEKLTDAEKKAIEDKVKAVNPDATVVVDDKGNATVTTPEGKTAVIPAADLTKSPEEAAKANAGNDIVKPADKTVVANPEKLTDAEKKAIEDKVKAVNPDATVVVDDKGNATVTTPEGKTAVIPAADLTKDPEAATKPNAGNDIVKPADKTAVANPEKLTDAEKKAIEDKVKAVNPDATVVVDDKGNATVTTPEGKTAVIPAADLTKDPETATKANAGNDIVKPADKTVVANPEKLTDAEKKAIEDKVKAVNPDATVVVDDKGNATVTTPEGKTAVIPAADLTKDPEAATKPNAGNDIVKPADKTVVANPEKLTDAEKKAIEDKVKAVNPDATVVVDDKGNATVTTPEGKTAVIPAADLTKDPEAATKPNAGNAVNTPAAKVEVKDPANLTDEEKAKVKKAIEAVNPGSKVVVDDKGNATVTTPEGNTAVIPAADVTKSAADADKANAGNAVNTPAAKTVVKDPANLTDAEKKAIEDKVKAVNPGSKVVVDDKGNATVTTPEGKTATIPATDLTKSAADAGKENAGNGANTPATKTVVKDPANLTDEEKAKVKKAVEAVNPGVTVVVDEKGNATVTKADGTVLNIPASDLVIPADNLADEAKNAKVKTPVFRTLVENKENLTKDEKEAVKKAIEAVNSGATVVVDEKGNATVTMPDGYTATISKEQLVKDKEAVSKSKHGGDNLDIDLSKVEVADLANITPEEKAKFQFKVLGAITDVPEFDLDAFLKETDDNGNTVYTSKDGKVKITIDKDGNATATVEKDGKTEAAVKIDKDGNVTIVTKEGQVLAIPRDDAFKQRPYVPSNGGGNNSGNGNGTSGNNAANNTDAKVNKAKLEGAIHQLDELIIKESAKFDAETAKEANALSADAKKVFANADASQAEVDAMVKRIEDFMAKVASSTDHATPANDQAAQKPAVAPATAQAAANASQEATTNARKAAKELPNTGTADSTVAMVAAAASALLGLGLAGRRRKEDEEA